MPLLARMEAPAFLGALVLMLIGAKIGGLLVQRLGQPAMLGELIAGVLLGPSAAAWIDPSNDVLRLMGELGVVLLLFSIGLETDLAQLIRLGGESFIVASVGVLLPFVFGYIGCIALGLSNQASILVGASLTATSVGITARVLSDLNRLDEPESQIILGAAVIDDIIGLVILTVVLGLTRGQEVTLGSILMTTVAGFGFLLGTLAIGRFLVPPAVHWASRIPLPGTATRVAIIVAFTLAWLADNSGSALIIGAFAAGLLLRETPQAESMRPGVAPVGHLFVPLFFILVGANVDLRALNPLNPGNGPTLVLGGMLLVAAVVGKFLAGYAPFWFKGSKRVIGVGMIPRGEVGLIFAQAGLDTKVIDPGQFSAVMVMVMTTTFIVPPLLKLVFPPRPLKGPHPPTEGIQDLVTEA